MSKQTRARWLRNAGQRLPIHCSRPFPDLDSMCLIDVDVLPLLLRKESLLEDDHLVGGDGDVVLGDLGLHGLALLGVAVEAVHRQVVRPAGDLAQPVARGRLGNDDQVRTGVVAVLLQVGKQRERLQRLALTERESNANSDETEQQQRTATRTAMKTKRDTEVHVSGSPSVECEWARARR